MVFVFSLILSPIIKESWSRANLSVQIGLCDFKMEVDVSSIQAMPKGGDLIISTEQADGAIEIKIKDSGLGMSQEELKRVFEPFYTTKPHSTGLGLAISHNIVQQQNGMLTVENLSTGRGVTFTVKLPLVN